MDARTYCKMQANFNKNWPDALQDATALLAHRTSLAMDIARSTLVILLIIMMMMVITSIIIIRTIMIMIMVLIMIMIIIMIMIMIMTMPIYTFKETTHSNLKRP